MCRSNEGHDRGQRVYRQPFMRHAWAMVDKHDKTFKIITHHLRAQEHYAEDDHDAMLIAPRARRDEWETYNGISLANVTPTWEVTNQGESSLEHRYWQYGTNNVCCEGIKCNVGTSPLPFRLYVIYMGMLHSALLAWRTSFGNKTLAENYWHHVKYCSRAP